MSDFEIGRTLPDWHLVSVGDGDVPDPGDFLGRPLLVLFFSLRCPGCVGRAVPFANRVIVERGDGVQVLGIHTTFEGPTLTDDEIRREAEALFVRFPVMRDAGLATTFHEYRAAGTPHWVLVDRSGTVLDSIFGSEPNRALLRLDYALAELEEQAAVGFGGGCHWCTEAVFQSLRGVDRVEQGWIRSAPPHEAESEAVVVHFRPSRISLDTLIEIHLLTHASTSDHAMREKYRSAIYTFNDAQREDARQILATLAEADRQRYITQLLPFEGFRLNQQDLLDYYRTRPDAPFCQTHISPKLRLLRERYGERVRLDAAPATSASDASADVSGQEAMPDVLTWREVIRYANHGGPEPPHRVEKTDAEWRALLSDEAYRVTRQRGTERAHSAETCSLFEPGRYACVCCETLLFDSATKFESGTGWPSFTQPVDARHVAYHKDASHGMTRIEAACNVCDAHLGHVFPDGPAPSGLRYCVNGVALERTDAERRAPPSDCSHS